MRIEYFAEGATECPLILIYGDSCIEANVLRQAVNNLANGTKISFALHDLPGFETIDQCQVLALAGLEDTGARETDLSNIFEWTLRPESWAHVADMIDPFCASVGETKTAYMRITPIISTLRRCPALHRLVKGHISA
jgi:hypothetical protein